MNLNGAEVPADWNTEQRFNDVPVNGADQELVKYAALVKDAGVFTGSNGNLMANNNITRQQMAKVLVEAFNTVYGVDLEADLPEDFESKLVDLDSVGDDFTGYVQVLEYFEITNVTTFNPTGPVTRGQLASFLYRALNNIEVVQEAAIESVTAVNKTTLTVVLNTEVDAVKAENFTIEGASVTAATLGEDKKTVTLTVSGLDYAKEYTVAAKDIEVDGEATDFGTSKFTTPAVTALWTLDIDSADSSLLADGADNTVLTFKLLNAQGQVDTNADNVVLDLNTTYGTLASKRVTIQDGVATVVLTSEFSNTNVSAKIDAQIIEASGDYKELIGEVFGTSYLPFVTSNTENVETITLVSAEANQADRVTLFFDKEVSVKHFVETNVAGDLLYKVGNVEYTANTIPAGTPASAISHVFKESNTLVIKQGTKTFTVKGVKPVAGNSKAVEVILDKTQDGSGNYTNALADNANVEVEVNAENSLGKETNSKASFKVTDARNPEATSVQVEGLNTLKVKFSEAIADSTFQIDGRFVEGSHFGVTYGEFNPVTYEDNRDVATIKLNAGYDEDGITDSAANNKTLAGFFSAGNHTVQVSSTKDFAYATDKNNIGQTQNLNFTVAEDKALPTASVVVESPEQFRIKFDKTVVLPSSVTVNSTTQVVSGLLGTGTGALLKLQELNANGEFVDSTLTSSDFIVTKVSNTEYVVELTGRDWTAIYDTANTNENYYNDKFRLVLAKGAVTNAANGLKNELINLDLNYAGSPLNTPDVTSPVINTIERVTTISENFFVTMSEPVKLVLNGQTSTEDNAGNTLAQGQSQLAPTTAQFIGKDKDGKTVTINANVKRYADKDAADKVIEIDWAGLALTPQQVVDAGGSEDWTLVVRSISHDKIFNTAASATKEFKIAKTPTANSAFYVEEEVANAGKGTHQAYALNQAAANGDTVEITFSEGVKVSGNNAATNPSFYTLNGKTLPAGTTITVQDVNSDTTDGFEKLVISLPEGTLNSGATV